MTPRRRIERQGVAGLRELNRFGRFMVADPTGFRASSSEITVDGVQLRSYRTTPLRGQIDRDGPGADATLAVVTDGTVECSLTGRVALIESGRALLICSPASVQFDARTASRVVAVSIPVLFLEPTARNSMIGRVTSVEPSLITTSLLSIAEALLDDADGKPRNSAVRALRPLAVAAIEELVPRSDPTDLRALIINYIERHLMDPELSVQAIADAFGISIRWVHQSFNVHESTVQRYIIERRLDLVVEHLLHDRRFPRVTVLAAKFGFSSRDHLSGQFKRRYGVTMPEFVALSAEGNQPAAL